MCRQCCRHCWHHVCDCSWRLRRTTECRGFEECPSYPMPYAWNEWPLTYDYEGAFPPDFVFGMGVAAFQIEGAYNEDGKGASIWDTFTGTDTVGMPGADCSYCCKKAPCPIGENMMAVGGNGSTGAVADDFYHMWETDLAVMRSMGLRAFRFSISWPRVIPTGQIQDGVNEKGIRFYNNLIDGLLAANITPYVTLYHWDLPQGLVDPKRGLDAWWSNDSSGVPTGQITAAFGDYADLCFREFGDRVKHWFTFNEPNHFLYGGVDEAPNTPQSKVRWPNAYVAAHNVLTAHGAVHQLYRSRYRDEQKGSIGIVFNQNWFEPNSTEPKDVAAAERALLFGLGWFADPIFSGTGDYPAPMRAVFRSQGVDLPVFTREQRQNISSSADFFAVNFYSSKFAGDADPTWGNTRSLTTRAAGSLPSPTPPPGPWRSGPRRGACLGGGPCGSTRGPGASESC
ncbi:unnamed protein product [Prorocentrum cordatum]|uniref:Beta-glucosidase n=1 Tax=Prorocentrum cordatum TaxID=2364126 RepID=A0ABN9VL53_9DINO|nr:unnamed protein product [Polarella glacialis]